jgi:hypothetical protein
MQSKPIYFTSLKSKVRLMNFFTSWDPYRHSKKWVFHCEFKWVFVSKFHCSILQVTGLGVGGVQCGRSCTPELRSLEVPDCWEGGLGSMHCTLTLLPDSIYGHVVLNVTVTCYISILLDQSQTKLKASFLAWNLYHVRRQNFFPSADV